MKIITILGTRPEIIRLSVIIRKLDKYCDHILVHTGQNYDHKLNDIFFKDLDVRNPNYIINSKADTFGKQLSLMYDSFDTIIKKEQPDKVLVLGDTNSGLLAILAERYNIPVYHMEAGNRCYDMKVPEEKNRKVIDSISSYNLPYTPYSRENLLREGYDKNRIFTSGNPIYEVINSQIDNINNSKIHKNIHLDTKYILATSHRAENVDNEQRLRNIFCAFEKITEKLDIPIIFSCHPRTKQKCEKYEIKVSNKIKLCEPFGFFDFISLEKSNNCSLIITDSGTVQEEACIFHCPSVVIRDTTERPETVECGSCIISGLEVEKILESSCIMVGSDRKWDIPIGYGDVNVSNKVANFILGK